jgi:hypothetical protein
MQSNQTPVGSDAISRHPLGTRPSGTDPMVAATRRANILIRLDLERQRRPQSSSLEVRVAELERMVEALVAALYAAGRP